MTGRSLPLPRARPVPRPDLRVCWCLLCVVLVLGMGMFGMPLINRAMGSPLDLEGQWHCTHNCSKHTSFLLKGGAVYLPGQEGWIPAGYWKLESQKGLKLQARSSNPKPFRWTFFTSSLQREVHYSLWSGNPSFCLSADRWCFSRTRV